MNLSSGVLKMQNKVEQSIVCIIGLGYVGLPLAVEFAQTLKVIGFDLDKRKVKNLNSQNRNQNLLFTNEPKQINRADFVIIAVPTPLTKSRAPDLSHVENAARTIAENLKPGTVVILESTVYPGVTEEVVKPILEKPGWKYGDDFKLAYSPERINPGDKEHTIRTITKVVSGMDKKTTEIVAQLYERVASNVFKAKDIRTAEAAKVIENIQRDLNIALMNELSPIFEKLGLNTRDVIETAATKWNFHRYSPGLVGGHCIPVDPYYMVHKAEELGYRPKVILAGRGVNDYMPKYVASLTIKALNQSAKMIKGSKVLIMGLTYKENVKDTRETPVKVMIAEFKDNGIEVLGYDPLVNDISSEFGIEIISDIDSMSDVDAVVLTVAHDAFREISLDRIRQIMSDSPILIDVRGFFDGDEAKERGFYYKTL